MSRKITSTVFGASLLLIIVNIISRGFGLFREMIFASTFGISQEFEIFLSASVIPLTINTSIIYISQNYFIPIYHKLDQENNNQINYFIRYSFFIYLIAGVLIPIFLYFGDELIIKLYLNGFDNSKINLAVKNFDLLVASIFPNALFSFFTAYLQAKRKFLVPAASQFLWNIAIILCTIILSSKIGILSISIGYLIGFFIQFIFVSAWSIKSIKNSLKKRISDFEFKTHISYSVSIIVLIEIISQLYLMIDRYFINEISQGGIASLNFASILYSLPISIISLAVGTAILPSLSESFHKKDLSKLSKDYNLGLKSMILFFAPVTVIFFNWGDEIIRLVYQRSSFGSNETELTFAILKMYSISFIFFGAYTVINKMIYSAQYFKQLLLITLFAIVIKIVFNIILVENGGEGLALSSSIAYIFITVSSFVLVKRKNNISDFLSLFKTILTVFLLSLLSLEVTRFISNLLILSQNLLIMLKLILFSFIFIFSTSLLKIEEFNEIIISLKGVLKSEN